MQISWFGYSAFRIQSEGTTLITDPVDQASKFKINKQGANIVVASHEDDALGSAVSGNPFIISGPGEYEIQSVFVQGVTVNGATVYVMTIEGISIAYVGALRVRELTGEQLSALEGVDILIVPVGGGSVCGAKEAVQIINQIEPRIVIPSYYKIAQSKGLDAVQIFLKEYAAPAEETDKFKIKKKDLPQEDTKVIVIKQ